MFEHFHLYCISFISAAGVPDEIVTTRRHEVSDKAGAYEQKNYQLKDIHSAPL